MAKATGGPASSSLTAGQRLPHASRTVLVRRLLDRDTRRHERVDGADIGEDARRVEGLGECGARFEQRRVPHALVAGGGMGWCARRLAVEPCDAASYLDV